MSKFFSFARKMKEVTTTKSFKSVPERREYLAIPSDDEAIIRILPHEMYIFWEHTAKKEGKIRQTKCTKLSDGYEGNCVGCYYGKRDKYEGKKLDEKLITTRKVQVFTVLDLRKVHTIIDEKGTKSVTPCRARKCAMCDSGNPSQIAGRRHWKLGKTGVALLDEANNEIGETCINCKTGTIEIIGMVCEECGAPVFDENDLFNMTPGGLRDATLNLYKCGDCGHEGFPKELIECNNCKEPERASILDTNLRVKKIKSDGKSAGIKITPTMKFEEIPEELMGVEPYNFEEIFGDLPLDTQASFLGLPNPYGVSQDTALNSNDAEEFMKNGE